MSNTYNRRKTRVVSAGGLLIGGNNPISVQSMTNTSTEDIEATVRQIQSLEEAGCELVRLAVPTKAAAAAISEIKRRVKIPISADIHYDYTLALAAMDAGTDALRLNPGNIGGAERVREVVRKAKGRGIPIRIGVNGGSLEKRFLGHGIDAGSAMAESAREHVRILEELEFYDIVISMKSSSVPATIKSHEILASETDYPMHIGITEAGTAYAGGIKSAAGIGSLLSRGIGDTIRVSLTGDPAEEVRQGKEILKAMELRCFGVVIVACPTCGRTGFDMAALAERVEKAVWNVKTAIKISIMGCCVNGPGEAREADIGVVGGAGSGALYRKGEYVKTVPEEELFAEVMREVGVFNGI